MFAINCNRIYLEKSIDLSQIEMSVVIIDFLGISHPFRQCFSTNCLFSQLFRSDEVCVHLDFLAKRIISSCLLKILH